MPLHKLSFPFQINRPYPFFSPATAEQAAAIFVHIPKTGGTSIHATMQLPPPDKTQGLFKHFSANAIVEHFPKELWQTVFKFSFIRHPLTRLYSHYQFRKRKGRIMLHYGRELIFSDWVAEALHPEIAGNLQPQCKWIYSPEGQLLVDFIGRFEHLHKDFAFVQEQLNMTPTALPHLNRSPKSLTYQQLYDPITYQKALDFYAEDFVRFGYSDNLLEL